MNTTAGNNAIERIRSFAERMERLMDELDERKEDLKEVELEAKVEGFNVAELKKWVNAKRKDKVEKRRADVVDAVLYADALGVDLGLETGTVPNNEVP